MHAMAAHLVGKSTRCRVRDFSGPLRILLIALPILISATVPAESQDFPQFKKIRFAAQPSASLSNEVGEAPSNDGRRSFQKIHEIFRPKGNTLGLTDCENSVVRIMFFFFFFSPSDIYKLGLLSLSMPCFGISLVHSTCRLALKRRHSVYPWRMYFQFVLTRAKVRVKIITCLNVGIGSLKMHYKSL